MLTIHALVSTETGEEWVPVCVAVLTSHDQSQYEAVVAAIKEKWAELGIKPNFGRIHTDYESGLMNAMKQLGTPEQVFGCDFHSSQAVYRALVNCKLFDHYMSGKKKGSPYESIRTWLRDILALPLLQKQDIQWYWENVLQYPPPSPDNGVEWPVAEMNKFKDYMQKQWISRNDNSWSFFGLQRVRNVNRAESYHSSGKKMFTQRPKYKVFVFEQRMFFTQCETRIHQLLMGDNPRPRLWKYEKLDILLQTFEREYLISSDKVSINSKNTVTHTFKFYRLRLTMIAFIFYDYIFDVFLNYFMKFVIDQQIP